jgi:hypothetical protein
MPWKRLAKTTDSSLKYVPDEWRRALTRCIMPYNVMLCCTPSSSLSPFFIPDPIKNYRSSKNTPHQHIIPSPNFPPPHTHTQVQTILPLLKRGVGIHHGGLLPILKEIIEILFQVLWIKLGSLRRICVSVILLHSAIAFFITNYY